jgi:NAD(P)H-hydrate epimerase
MRNYKRLYIEEIAILLKDRAKDAYKYSLGHALLMAGQKKMLGCMILAAKAAQRSGVGLISIWSIKEATDIIHTCIPEALIYDKARKYDAIGIGPGIGTKTRVKQILEILLKDTTSEMLLDADALNIISDNLELLELIPEESVLTPHIGEFDRLFGKSRNIEERIEKQIFYSQKYKLNIILKGPESSVSISNGSVFRNTTGNAGMATAGSGDVLSGIVLALLAQGYSGSDSAKIGVFVHGLAGDIAADSLGQISLIASDIIDFLPQAWQEITKYTNFA